MKFMDLVVKEKELREEIKAVFERVLSTGSYVGGEMVENFEKDFADWVGTRFCVSVSSGTDALKYIYMAMGVGPGDEIITTPLTFIATAEAAALLGARPVFVDVEPDTFLMDPEKLASAITERTKLIVPVHLFGSVCDMDRINQIASRAGVEVVEDAAQAHGATYKGRKAGSLGKAAAFSFYPTKNLSAFGEAGAVTTSSQELARRVSLIKNHGQTGAYYHEILGENGRMDALQAGILRAKLKYIDSWNEKRRKLASVYLQILEGEDLIFQRIPDHVNPVYHLFVVLHPERDKIHKLLQEEGIPSRIYYPVPLHLQPVFSHLHYKEGDFPNAEKISRQLLALPIGPWLEEEEVAYIAERLKKILRKI